MNHTPTYYRIKGELLDYLPIDMVTEEFLEAYMKIRRLAKQHHRLAEMSCNGEGYLHGRLYTYHSTERSPYAAQAQVDDDHDIFDVESDLVVYKIQKLAKSIGLHVEFQGDPRGATVKLYTIGTNFNRYLPVLD